MGVNNNNKKFFFLKITRKKKKKKELKSTYTYYRIKQKPIMNSGLLSRACLKD